MRGTKTTWGMTPYRDRVIDHDSTVYTRLTDAGAILVAKLSTGALAVTRPLVRRASRGVRGTPRRTRPDRPPGQARRPPPDWSGLRSAPTPAARSSQPSSRNGITGLRPTFGRVSRDGAMVLAWTQDTVGPMCRSAEDCALVLHAIHGPDGRDNSVTGRAVQLGRDRRREGPARRLPALRVRRRRFRDAASPGDAEFQRATRANNQAALDVIRSLGVEVVPVRPAGCADRRDRLHPLRRDGRVLR